MSLPTWVPGPEALRQSAHWFKEAWDRFQPERNGKQLFSQFLATTIPYTGSIHAEVEDVRPGSAHVLMPDRPELRNHLGSVHAIALCNLAELTANLALGYSLPERSRFIVTRLDIEYLKKAVGPIQGRSTCPIPATNQRQEYTLPVTLHDQSGDVVARATLISLVGPSKG
jgi:acyl-coenzyme A thioesterase PaaI-like protein